MLYLLLVALMVLLCSVGVASRYLIEIFMPVAFVTRIITRIEPFGKKVRWRGGRRSGVMLATEVTRLLLMPVAMSPMVASPGSPTVTLLFLLIVLIISSVFFGFLLNR
jgi:hypothetical protein